MHERETFVSISINDNVPTAGVKASSIIQIMYFNFHQFRPPHLLNASRFSFFFFFYSYGICRRGFPLPVCRSEKYETLMKLNWICIVSA